MSWKLREDRAEAGFNDYKPAYSTNQAMAEASRCLFCFDAPCVRACPTGIDIPQFIRKITTGNIEGSARTIFDSNILGYSCACACPVEVLCVGACVYNNEQLPPIQIGRLQRYSTAMAIREGWSYFEAGAPTGKSIGLIGAGPASVACAHRLRRLGHSCTIYEKNVQDNKPLPGGLNTTGIAPYKLKADEAIRELEYVISEVGIELVAATVGVDISLEELEKRHDAVFVGMGLGPDRRLAGSELAGVHGAVAWIEAMKLGPVDLSGVTDAVVLGGGNTAMDCIRELAGLGVPRVSLVYRGTESRMSGYKHEWEAARKAGVMAVWEASPVGFEGAGSVSGVRVMKNGQEQVIPAQLVLQAIGQSKLGDSLKSLGIAVEEGGRLLATEGRLSRPRWYAGGDCANGGKEVVNAVAEGRDAALVIHHDLEGQ
jgi:glutamate synthase (NADPH/NADH) small chain